ncbi:SagB/ThcOx family dehydrogenase [Yimella sp. cx-51]|uniref:SagB/ThcOx family dehydrogenase n=1 Tax=Yimella sp. cx-51 TaxID=2770551 RepID=UPI00165DE999|nr:SagB/ThcOx family dehydrogenase [Yimella sp. cx-51]MBC9957968.1 SagB/ThcOx family dehydrogenase [Yimella sp. cx-51]QTH38097.1 SagB/ThcOx family dehydrogenase [Yimella sp. cx-51]
MTTIHDATELLTITPRPGSDLPEEVLEQLSGLGPEASRAVEEFAASIKDLTGATDDPSLRQILHRVFVRSVNEFFTATNSSMQLPRELMPTIRPSQHQDAIDLPEPERDRDIDLDEVLVSRRSHRSFASEPMPLQTLATILGSALGKVASEDGYGVRDLPLFPYPSMGGLSAFEVGVIVQRVEDVPNGYYVYDQVGHRLVPKVQGDLRLALQDVTFESEWLMYAPVVLTVAGRAVKSEWKYHTRGYRIGHIDMGAAVQTLYLSAWASKVGTCAVAGFFDEAINTLLGYDGVNDYVSLLIGMGAPATPILAPR